MADLIRLGGHGGHSMMGGIQRDRMNSPSSGSDDGNGCGGGGAIDLADLAHELDQDEFDGPAIMGGGGGEYIVLHIAFDIGRKRCCFSRCFFSIPHRIAHLNCVVRFHKRNSVCRVMRLCVDADRAHSQ